MPKIDWFTAWLTFATLALFLAALAFIGGIIHFGLGYCVS